MNVSNRKIQIMTSIPVNWYRLFQEMLLKMKLQKFLEKYYPLALQEPVAVPIRKIAEDMGLSIIEDSLLSSELDIFGLVVFEDGNIKDKNKNIVIRNAKRGTVLIDPCVYYERTLGTVNFTIAHECFHWYRHQIKIDALMKMLGANDELGKIIQCSIGNNAKDSEKGRLWIGWSGKLMELLHIS